jgi:hypothetical protein
MSGNNKNCHVSRGCRSPLVKGVMKLEKDEVWILSYFILLTMCGCVFLGHEAARIIHKMDREMANSKLVACNRILTGVNQ